VAAHTGVLLLRCAFLLRIDDVVLVSTANADAVLVSAVSFDCPLMNPKPAKEIVVHVVLIGAAKSAFLYSAVRYSAYNK
jgi:hypothetical protein